MAGYYIEGNIITVTTMISVEMYKTFKELGYIVKFLVPGDISWKMLN